MSRTAVAGLDRSDAMRFCEEMGLEPDLVTYVRSPREVRGFSAVRVWRTPAYCAGMDSGEVPEDFEVALRVVERVR